jgi:hypothetical protein
MSDASWQLLAVSGALFWATWHERAVGARTADVVLLATLGVAALVGLAFTLWP